MTDRPDINPEQDLEDADTGRPVLLLADLQVPPSDGFIDRLKGRIERRKLGGEMTGLMWFAPGLVLLEMLEVLFRALGIDNQKDR